MRVVGNEAGRTRQGGNLWAGWGRALQACVWTVAGRLSELAGDCRVLSRAEAWSRWGCTRILPAAVCRMED